MATLYIKNMVCDRCKLVVRQELEKLGLTPERVGLGEVTVKVDFGDKELVTGKGASTDIIEASARAYLNAVNRFLLAANGTKRIAEHP